MSVLSDTADPLWLWLESVSGAGVSGERAGESTLLHDHYGGSAERAQCRTHSQEPRDRQIEGHAHAHAVPTAANIQRESYSLLNNQVNTCNKSTHLLLYTFVLLLCKFYFHCSAPKILYF